MLLFSKKTTPRRPNPNPSRLRGLRRPITYQTYVLWTYPLSLLPYPTYGPITYQTYTLSDLSPPYDQQHIVVRDRGRHRDLVEIMFFIDAEAIDRPFLYS